MTTNAELRQHIEKLQDQLQQYQLDNQSLKNEVDFLKQKESIVSQPIERKNSDSNEPAEDHKSPADIEFEKLVGFCKHSALDVETTFRRFSSGLELNSNGIRKVCEILKLTHDEGGLFS